MSVAALLASFGESPFLPLHIVLLRFLNQSFGCTNHDVGQIVASIFCFQPKKDRNGRTNGEECMLSLSDKDFMSNLQKDYQLNAENWSRERNFGDKNAPQAVFNALNNMLEDSLARLQKMGKSIYLVKLDLVGYTCKYCYIEYTAIIRMLCLESKLADEGRFVMVACDT